MTAITEVAKQNEESYMTHLVSMVRHAELMADDQPAVSRRTNQWWIGAAIAVGLAVGVGGVVAFDVPHAPFGAQAKLAPVYEVTQTVVPVAYAPTEKHVDASDLETIKARNRRLEALVKVLRRRQTDPLSSSTTHAN